MLVLAFLTGLLGLLCAETLLRQIRRQFIAVDNSVLHDQILAYHLDWKAIQDQKFLVYLYVKKVNAIVRYQALAGVSHQEAETAIEYLLAHPELLPQIPQKRRPALPQAEDERLRNLIHEGHEDEAAKLFQDLVDVDFFTAQQVILAMKKTIEAENAEVEEIFYHSTVETSDSLKR